MATRVNTYQQDEDLNVSMNTEQLRRAFGYIKPYKSEFIATIVIMLLATTANMSIPYIVQIALDDMIPQENIAGLITLGMICIGIFVWSVFAAKFRMKHMNFVGQSIIYDLRKDLFAHLQKLSFRYFDSRPHGKILVRIVNYVNSLSDMFSNGLVNTLLEMASLIVIVVFMFAVNVKLALISLVGFPLLAAVIAKLRAVHHKAWQIYSDKNSNLNAYLHESINGVRVTQAFVRERTNGRIFSRLSADTMRTWMKAKCIEFLIWPTSTVISELTVCVIYFVGAAAVSRESLSVGVIIAMISYIWRFWTPINNICNVYNSLMTNTAYLERIFEVMEEEPEIRNAANAQVLPHASGEVEFKNVSFGYEPEQLILKDISFKIKPGMTVALVGPTGAGKSTIVNLLSRYYDINQGQILIDGYDISKVTLESLRAQLGYMLQDSFIFTGTILDNICYGRLDATKEEAVEAAKAVHADEFIRQLPKGYDTYVSERGSSLSAGQRQLISLARAMLRDPSILILDEATSSIDTETEIKLMDGIHRILENRTSFVIAHRLSTIRSADLIMVIDQQTILEAGSHEELMARKGVYHRLYQTQMSLEH